MGKERKAFFAAPFNFVGFSDGESIQDICYRTQQFLKELIMLNDGKKYLTVIHGCA